MTEETNSEIENKSPSTEESTGDEALDRRLAEPILRGDKGLDTAQIWISGFLIVLAGVIAYSNAIAIPFHGSDFDLVVNNVALQHPATFAQALDAQRPRVVTMLSLAFNWWITKGNATSFHVFNLLIHLINGLLVFLLCRRLLNGKISEAVAMLAGLLFVLHPALTESVNLVVGRAELLATLFSLSSILLFARAIRNPDQPCYGALCASWCCYFLAMASHENAFFLPFFLILFHLRVGSESTIVNPRLLHLPYLGLMLAWSVAHASGTVLNPFRNIVASAANVKFVHRVINTLYPAGLTICRDASASIAVSAVVVNIAVCIILALLLFAVCRYRLSVAAWAIAVWFFGLVFVELNSPAGSFVSDRDQYFPLVGAALLIPTLLASVLSGPRARVVSGLIAAALVITAGVATFSRNNVWVDEPTLWQDAAAKAPNSPKPPQILGQYFLAAGRDQLAQLRSSAAQSGKTPDEQSTRAATELMRQAEQFLAKAKELDAHDSRTLSDLGAAQSLLGKPDEAINNLLDALRLDTQNQTTTIALATALDDRWRTAGKREDMLRAIEYFRRAERLGPLSGEAAARYGMALLIAGDFKSAEPVLRAAVGTETNSPLATPIKESQDRQKTIQAATNKVISLLGNQPHNPEGLRLLGQVYILAGHFQNALYTANQVLKDAPQDLEAWIQMGVAEARMNSIDQFVKEWPAPSASASPWNQLALTCASVGMWEEAQTYLGKAGGATPNLLQMGDIAIQLKQTRRAWDYLRRATEATPEDPRPWLRLSDIAAAANNTKDASDFLVEAAKRNADTNELATRRQKLGITAPPAMTGAVKTMIR